MLNVIIGYDNRIPEDFKVTVASLTTTSSVPLAITPLNLTNFSGIYNREPDPKSSNEFSYTRYLAPYLCDYTGWSLFVDSDMVFLNDVWQLFLLRNDEYAVQVVKHPEYTPQSTVKFGGAIQYKYPRKNWSSVMLFNNAKCRTLTVDKINNSSPAYLHRFKWLQDEEIGELPRSWNYLVGEYDDMPLIHINLLHYTEGTPLWEEYRNCDFSEEWLKYGRKYI